MVRTASTTPSDQPTKWYPSFGVADNTATAPCAYRPAPVTTPFSPYSNTMRTSFENSAINIVSDVTTIVRTAFSSPSDQRTK